MVKVFFLGTNGWFDSKTGNTICTLIRAKECNIILDAGFGLGKADKYLNNNKPTGIFLSHLHLDHIVGLHALAKFKFPKGLFVFAPSSALKKLNDFIAQPFTIAFKDLPFKTKVAAAKKNMQFCGVKIKSLPMVHSSDCLGYRFEFSNKTIAYCTDTGVCDNVTTLANKANMLIAECALRKDQDHGGWPHLDARQAAYLAEKSLVKELVLTHFDADNHPTRNSRMRAQTHARKVFPNSISAVDGLIVEV